MICLRFSVSLANKVFLGADGPLDNLVFRFKPGRLSVECHEASTPYFTSFV